MTVYDSSWKTSETHRSHRGGISLFGNLVVLAAVAMLYASLTRKIDDEIPAREALGRQVAAAESELERIRAVVGEHSQEMMTIALGEVERTDGIVALDNPEAQLIGNGFAVTRLEFEMLGTGCLIQGRIINLQAVKHAEIAFRMTLAQASFDFSTSDLEPGQSRPFTVFVPEMSAEVPRYARIDYRKSIIWHQAAP